MGGMKKLHSFSYCPKVNICISSDNEFILFVAWIPFNFFLWRSILPEVFSEKGFPKICSKFTGEHPCWSVISIKFQSNVTEITLRHGCYPVNLLHIFRKPFAEYICGELLRIFGCKRFSCVLFWKVKFYNDCNFRHVWLKYNKVGMQCMSGRE